jgi:hypothetical protein
VWANRSRDLLLAAALIGGLCAPAAVLGPAPASAIVVPHRLAASRHPHRHNIAPKPNYFAACSGKGFNSKRCIKRALAAIRHARSGEHMKRHAMVLPRNYRSLTVAEQTFVITDLERVDRGLKPFEGLSTTLDGLAKVAASLHLDLSLATPVLRALHIQSYGSNWAGDLGPLGADYDWMYRDGYSKHGGINLACPRPLAPLCWGHRSNVLWPYPRTLRLVAGVGTAGPAGSSIAQVLAAAGGAAPKYAYTWRAALRHGADGHRVKSRH